MTIKINTVEELYYIFLTIKKNINIIRCLVENYFIYFFEKICIKPRDTFNKNP